MSLTDAFVFEPFSVNQPLIDSLLLEPDSFEVYVAIGSGGGSGTISDPYLVNTASLFDPLMNSFQPYTTVHLGPGLFPTQGHADGVGGGWQPKRGQRIVGSGIDVTTVKLAPASPTADKAYFAIGVDDLALIDGFEASDFTFVSSACVPSISARAAPRKREWSSPPPARTRHCRSRMTALWRTASSNNRTTAMFAKPRASA